MKIKRDYLKRIVKEEYTRILMEQLVREEPASLEAMDAEQLMAMLQATECPVARQEIEIELSSRAMEDQPLARDNRGSEYMHTLADDTSYY